MGYLEDVRQALLNRCPAMLYEWLPGGRQEGHYYVCADITGGNGKSLKVNLKTGRWEDYSQGHQPGTYGSDLVSLYAANKGKEYKEALHELAAMFGIKPEKLRRSDPTEWQLITPAPRSAYQVSPDGVPILPDIPAVKGNVGYWSYTDRDGELLCFRYRIESGEVNELGKRKKDIKPLTYRRNKRTGECAWITKDLPSPLPLYNLFDLVNLEPRRVLIVEGDKSAAAGQKVLPNWTVTTWPGGTRRVRMADWSPIKVLPDETMIVLWPDNDAAGQQAMNDVLEILDRPVDIVRPDQSWPSGYDIADLVEHGWDTAKIETFIAQNTHRVEPEPRRERPEVELTGQDYYEHMKSVYPAIRDSESPLYEAAGGIIVHIKKDIFGNQYVVNVGSQELQAWAARYLACYRYTANGRTPCGISDQLASALIYNCNGHLLPLVRYADHPIITATGELIDRPGYSPSARCYLSIPDGYDPDMPLDQAIDAVIDLLRDFPFEDQDADLAAAVAFPLTSILRDRIPGPVPLTRFEAPAAGTGKSLLCQVLAKVVTPNPGVYGLPREEEETRKQITTAIAKLPSVVIWDNVRQLESEVLCRAITEPVWKDRLLGGNHEVNIPIRNLWAATTNNPSVSTEILRRSVRVRLDAGVEHPERRTGWLHPHLEKYVEENRGYFVSAFVSIAKNGIDKESQSLPVMGRFEPWVKAIAPCLEAAGFTGFLRNVDRDWEESVSDIESDRRVLVEMWAENFGSAPVSVKQLAEMASGAQLAIFRRNRNGEVTAESVGRVLRSMRKVVYGKYRVTGPFHGRHGNTWVLKGAEDSQQGQLEITDGDDDF